MTRKTGTWAAARVVALAVLAVPLFPRSGVFEPRVDMRYDSLDGPVTVISMG